VGLSTGLDAVEKRKISPPTGNQTLIPWLSSPHCIIYAEYTINADKLKSYKVFFLHLAFYTLNGCHEKKYW
jgi:hypothetical protein